MTGQAADIIHIHEYTWFDWVIFRDGPHVSYPEDILVLGQYLGPTLNVGLAMCAKLLKNIGKVVQISTLRTMTREEIDIPFHKEQRRQFYASIITCLGTAAMDGELTEDHVTPVYELYDDNEDDQEGMADDQPEELAPTPDVGDTYVNK